MDTTEVAEFLASVRLFRKLDPRQRQALARRFEFFQLKEGQYLFREGEPGGDFYIITSGEIHLARGEGSEREDIGNLTREDFLGEESYLRNREHNATAVAVRDTGLIKLAEEEFGQLLEEHDEIRDELEMLIKSYRLARHQDFEWLGDDEIIHMISQKHLYVLLHSLTPSLIIAAIGLIPLSRGLLAPETDFTSMLIAFFGVLLTVPSLLWGLWQWIDWGNDYYVVTDKRVIWLEKIVLLYESRNEAPLDAVLSVDVNTSYWQRLWGSGNVVVNTYTGRIVMRMVDRPHQLAAIIEEFWQRARRRASEEEQQMRVQVLRENLGFEESRDRESEPVQPQEEPPSQEEAEKPRLSQRIANLLKTRFEENGIVTYRKHWFRLMRRIWIVLTIFTLMSLYLLVRVVMFLVSETPADPVLVFGTPLTLMAGFILISSPYWIYHLIDWGNDIYQVDHRHIYDIDRKPLGQDVRRSAPLERILNTSVEQNFLQRLLNYGTVVINVGEATFTFDGVVNPSMVQQEVFQRYYARKQQIEAQKAKRERERMVEWLKIYHQQTDGERSPDHEPDFF